MNKRLQQFIFAENISQSAFADTIGVARASVSHILSGRNKPGFDFIENLTRAYPALNIEWLITGEGKMYKTSREAVTPPAEQDLFSSLPPAEVPADTLVPQPQSVHGAPIPRQRPDSGSNLAQKIDINSLDDLQQAVVNKKFISKIIVFFSDGSFREIAA
ncbi:MAG: helix-turn-helix transcriptional regulator [Bacteroidales bacterium]|nr:helix-turn-helix transcriptional regulator [Bacteroidales bacterium]